MATAEIVFDTEDEAGPAGPRARLVVVVASRCWDCKGARSLARELQRQFPSVAVELIELDGRRPAPKWVVATPTYLLDGAVIALGNPDREALAREIARRAG